MRSTNGANGRKIRGVITGSKKLGVLLIGLIEAGVIEPPLELERRYFDRRLKAQIERDGSVTCMGKSFCTLCSAATYARETCSDVRGADSHTRSSNGWAFWQFRNQDGELENIGALRRRFLRG